MSSGLQCFEVFQGSGSTLPGDYRRMAREAARCVLVTVLGNVRSRKQVRIKMEATRNQYHIIVHNPHFMINGI